MKTNTMPATIPFARGAAIADRQRQRQRYGRGERGVSRAPSPAPARSAVLLDGQIYDLFHWTEEEWDCTPEARRPSVTFEDDRGGRFAMFAMGAVE